MASLLAIFYQDIKDRQVFWWLFLVIASGVSTLHILNVGWLQFFIHSSINMVLIGSVLLILWGYARFKMGVNNLRAVFALGDILFLLALALGFSTVSFVTFFVFGLLFSLILHLVMSYLLSRKRSSETMNTTVPLAGYLALFFSGVFAVHWFGFYEDLYLL